MKKFLIWIVLVVFFCCSSQSFASVSEEKAIPVAAISKEEALAKIEVLSVECESLKKEITEIKADTLITKKGFKSKAWFYGKIYVGLLGACLVCLGIATLLERR